MAKFEPVYAVSVDSMESRKRKGNGVPLPYLIRPRRKEPLYDSFSLYNDYVENSSFSDGWFSESDEDDLSMEAVETSALEKGNCFSLQNESNATMDESSDHLLNDEKEEEFVLVHISNAEKVVAIQMMELSKDLPVSPLASDGVSEKDTGDKSESGDAGSESDDWVVV